MTSITNYKKEREEIFNKEWSDAGKEYPNRKLRIKNFNSESIDGAFALIEKEIEGRIWYGDLNERQITENKTLKSLLTHLKDKSL